MTAGRFVSYLRVSTAGQGQSGLGLEAQRAAVLDYLNGGDRKLVTEVAEVESGRQRERPKLQEALGLCRVHRATLLVAKLDRLARDAHFLLGLKDAGVDFVCFDMPSANRLTVSIMAMVAEEEGRMISARTKAALAAAKARGVKLGRPNLTRGARRLGAENSARLRGSMAQARAADLSKIITKLPKGSTATPTALATTLNTLNVPAARGGKWTTTQATRLMVRIASLPLAH